MQTLNLNGAAPAPRLMAWIADTLEKDGEVIVVGAQPFPMTGTAAYLLGQSTPFDEMDRRVRTIQVALEARNAIGRLRQAFGEDVLPVSLSPIEVVDRVMKYIDWGAGAELKLEPLRYDV